MIEYNKNELGKVSEKYGFVRDTFEKVLRLTEVLRFIYSDEILSKHLVLKGGTAINLALFDLPRLSVDIDLDYVPNSNKDEMLKVRSIITGKLSEYMQGEGYTLSQNSRYSHSLDSFLFTYTNSGGRPDVIKVEINYSLRAHVFEPIKKDIDLDFMPESVAIVMVDPIEIYAAKINALLSRAASRDLYDVNAMVKSGIVSDEKRDLFRKCIAFYACISAEEINKEFNTAAIDSLTIAKIKKELFPVLGKQGHYDLDAEKAIAKDYINDLMILNESETEFVELFDKGIYNPEMLFEDKKIIDKIKEHPMAIWKCGNKNKE